MNELSLLFRNFITPKDVGMNNFKLSFFTAAMSLSMYTMAADTNGNSIRVDRNTDSNNSNESMEMRDCIDKSGNDKAACDKKMAKDRAESVPNQNSRLNRNKNKQLREDIKSNELNSGRTQSQDRQIMDKQPKDMKSRNLNTEKMTPNDSNPPSSGQDSTNRSGTSNTM